MYLLNQDMPHETQNQTYDKCACLTLSIISLHFAYSIYACITLATTIMQYANSNHESKKADIDYQIYLIEYYSTVVIISAMIYGSIIKFFLNIGPSEAERNIWVDIEAPTVNAIQSTNHSELEQGWREAQIRSRETEAKQARATIASGSEKFILILGKLHNVNHHLMKMVIIYNNGLFRAVDVVEFERTIKLLKDGRYINPKMSLDNYHMAQHLAASLIPEYCEQDYMSGYLTNYAQFKALTGLAAFSKMAMPKQIWRGPVTSYKDREYQSFQNFMYEREISEFRKNLKALREICTAREAKNKLPLKQELKLEILLWACIFKPSALKIYKEWQPIFFPPINKSLGRVVKKSAKKNMIKS